MFRDTLSLRALFWFSSGLLPFPFLRHDCNSCVFPTPFLGRDWKCCVFPVPFPGRDWKCCVFPVPFPGRDWKCCVFPVPFLQRVRNPVFFQFPFRFPVPFQFPSQFPSRIPCVFPRNVRCRFFSLKKENILFFLWNKCHFRDLPRPHWFNRGNSTGDGWIEVVRLWQNPR